MTSARFAARITLVIASLIALASLGGILFPSIYAHEAPAWKIQAIGQDWIDLLVAVPWLFVSALATRAGSRRARLLVAGGLVYTVYSFLIYAFAVHFNALFLLYCAVLGLSVLALIAVSRALLADSVAAWFDGNEPRRSIAVFLMGSAVVFALLWLAQIVPATLRGGPGPELAELGLPTNPVHVIDLSVVLPTMFAGGVALWRGREVGYVVSLAMLGFAVLMDVTITVLTIAMNGPVAVTAALAAMTVASSMLLVRALRAVPVAVVGS